MNIIAAIDRKGGLGKDGQLLVRLGADMKRFKMLTSGGVVIMGRKTLDSLPKGKPLPNRRNIVLTRNENFSREGVEVARSVLEVLQLVREENKDKVCVIGGGEIYSALIPFCEKCYLTRIDEEFEADTFFPTLNNDWVIEDLGYLLKEQDIVFSFEIFNIICSPRSGCNFIISNSSFVNLPGLHKILSGIPILPISCKRLAISIDSICDTGRFNSFAKINEYKVTLCECP